MTIRAGCAALALLTAIAAGTAHAQAGPQTRGGGENDPRRPPAAAALTTYPAAAAENGATTDGYNLSRWAEDWSGLRDPVKRIDWIDRLKYLPLDHDGDVYLALTGEQRLRVNHTTNPNLRDARAQRQDIRRLVGGADLHLGLHLRAYGEIAHGGISGVELGPPAATLRNDFVVQQAFVEGDAEIAGVATGVRVGRQEFTDGPNLFVSQRDNNTIRYTLNGWHAWAQAATVRIDPFLWRRRNRVGTWGDRVGPATRHYGGGATPGAMSGG